MTAQEIQQIREWRKKRLTWDEIAKATNLKRGTVQKAYWRATSPQKAKAEVRKRNATRPSRAKNNGQPSEDLRTLLKQALKAEYDRAREVEQIAAYNAELFGEALRAIEEAK